MQAEGKTLSVRQPLPDTAANGFPDQGRDSCLPSVDNYTPAARQPQQRRSSLLPYERVQGLVCQEAAGTRMRGAARKALSRAQQRSYKEFIKHMVAYFEEASALPAGRKRAGDGYLITRRQSKTPSSFLNSDP